MNRFSRYPFLGITAALISGVGLQHYIALSSFGWSLGISLTALLVLIWLSWLNKWPVARGILTFLAFFFVGQATYIVHEDSFSRNHLSHLNLKVEAYQAEVYEQLDYRESGLRVKARVIAVADSMGWHKAAANISLFISDTLLHSLMPGDRLLIRSFPKPAMPPKNPEQFDYQAYLALQNIHYQDYVASDDYHITGKGFQPLRRSATKASGYLTDILAKQLHDSTSFALANAMLLGDKDFLETGVKNIFMQTGVMHILAVSGLHVGILLGIVMMALGWIKYLPNGQLLFVICCILLLWCYAWLTGLSPSVTRASTMFSLLSVGQLFSRQRITINIVLGSAFFMILLKPLVLFQVGFQLSYAAVFAIIFLYPLFYRLWNPPNWLSLRIWQLICVSMAAQIGTLPVSLYYFHQFPTYFLLGNLVAIPLATVLLVSSLANLAFSWVPVLNEVVAAFMQLVTVVLTKGLTVLSVLPSSVIGHIHFSPMVAWLIIGIIITVAAMMLMRNIRISWIVMVLLIFFAATRIHENNLHRSYEGGVIYSDKELVMDYFHSSGWTTNNAAALNFNTSGMRDKYGGSRYSKPAVLEQNASLTLYGLHDMTVLVVNDGDLDLNSWQEADIVIFKDRKSKVHGEGLMPLLVHMPYYEAMYFSKVNPDYTFYNINEQAYQWRRKWNTSAQQYEIKQAYLH